ncbi:hypothetical protein ACL2XP_07515 [Sodalis sp. RH21]|uniref:hypothetical protein n=1 Tax=unclassified Sodalis (in: enterobacteria) TaxID=2636512 RepID=UPI0039B50E97
MFNGINKSIAPVPSAAMRGDSDANRTSLEVIKTSLKTVCSHDKPLPASLLDNIDRHQGDVAQSYHSIKDYLTDVNNGRAVELDHPGQGPGAIQAFASSVKARCEQIHINSQGASRHAPGQDMQPEAVVPPAAGQGSDAAAEPAGDTPQAAPGVGADGAVPEHERRAVDECLDQAIIQLNAQNDELLSEFELELNRVMDQIINDLAQARSEAASEQDVGELQEQSGVQPDAVKIHLKQLQDKGGHELQRVRSQFEDELKRLKDRTGIDSHSVERESKRIVEQASGALKTVYSQSETEFKRARDLCQSKISDLKDKITKDKLNREAKRIEEQAKREAKRLEEQVKSLGKKVKHKFRF